METGLLLRWGSVIPGREDKGLALFYEAVRYYSSLMDAGKVTTFETFPYNTSDFEAEQGFFIIKGPVASILETMESDEYKILMVKPNLLLHHLSVSLLAVGDSVIAQLDRFNKAQMSLNI